MRPKIGAVSYLNTKPLVHGLEDAAKEFELIYDLPSRLADRLSRGELEVALIPVIEAVANPDYTIVSDACIACDGPVWSVKLMSKVDGPHINSLSLDEGSRTSRALSKVILGKMFGVQPDLVSLGIDQQWRDVETDAVLIIGDRAMNAESTRFPFAWDLGETWKALTGKPFVFAVWAARPGADLKRLESVLVKARDEGLAHVPEIASDQAESYGLSQSECLKYLNEHLHFLLGSNEKSGMELFFQYADELNLIPNGNTEIALGDSRHTGLQPNCEPSSTTRETVDEPNIEDCTNPRNSRLRFYDCQTNSHIA